MMHHERLSSSASVPNTQGATWACATGGTSSSGADARSSRGRRPPFCDARRPSPVARGDWPDGGSSLHRADAPIVALLTQAQYRPRVCETCCGFAASPCACPSGAYSTPQTSRATSGPTCIARRSALRRGLQSEAFSPVTQPTCKFIWSRQPYNQDERGGEAMAQLSARAIRVLAVLEDYRGGGTGDILDALLPFFEPTVAEFAGKIFDPELCAERIREEHRWNITKDVIEEFVPRFVKNGWLQLVTEADASVYKGTYSGLATVPARTEVRITETLAKIVAQFRAFISELSPLSVVNLTNEFLAESLVEWLVSEDAYSVDALREHVASALDGERDVTATAASPPSSTILSSEIRYLCARFIKHLFAAQSELIPELCKLASVGLLTEVIRDLNAPTTKVNRTDLVVYLDAPVALDLLGVSGTNAAENIRMLVSQLQGIGAAIRIFRSSVDELTNALDAVLRRAAVSRFGATADARGETKPQRYSWSRLRLRLSRY